MNEETTRYCNACISWRSTGIRPFGKCRLTGESKRDLHTCDEHMTHDEARALAKKIEDPSKTCHSCVMGHEENAPCQWWEGCAHWEKPLEVEEVMPR